MRRVLVLTMLGALVAVSLGADVSAGASEKSSANRLADGFVVARGSRLIGTVFPDEQDSSSPSWSALLLIDASPLDVYDRYVEQARALGFMLPGSGTVGFSPTCRLVVGDASASLDTATDAQVASADAIACDGSAFRSDGDTVRTVSLSVYWGGVTRHASLRMGSFRRPSFPVVDFGVARAAPRPRLPKLTKQSTVTEPGTAFGFRFDGFEDGRERRLRLEDGSRLAGPSTCCTPFPMAVLRVDGGTKSVLQHYGHQLGVRHPSVQTTALSNGKKTMTFSHETDSGGARFITDPTGQWILIEVYTD